jgi:hypothetical protein
MSATGREAAIRYVGREEPAGGPGGTGGKGKKSL